MLRYDVQHPVVNDSRMALWRDLGISSWPTLVVVSPKGRAIFTVAGACSAVHLSPSSYMDIMQSDRIAALCHTKESFIKLAADCRALGASIVDWVVKPLHP